MRLSGIHVTGVSWYNLLIYTYISRTCLHVYYVDTFCPSTLVLFKNIRIVLNTFLLVNCFDIYELCFHHYQKKYY